MIKKTALLLLTLFAFHPFAIADKKEGTSDHLVDNDRAWTGKENKGWKVVNRTDSNIVPGSALDLGGLFAADPAGTYGRVIINKNGKTAFKDKPEQEIRFWGSSMPTSDIINENMSHKDIENYVKLLRKHGHNLVRPHFLDDFLTQYADKDLDFDPIRLDNWEYLVYCLKKEGIYIYFDAMTSTNGFSKGSVWTPEAQKKNFKERIFYDKRVRKHYINGVKKLLTKVNPYTKIKLVNDPVIAVILPFNEQNIHVWSMVESGTIQPIWKKWLVKKYKTNQALKKGWTDTSGKVWLEKGQSLSNLPNLSSKQLYNRNPITTDAAYFFHEMHQELMGWYKGALKEMGYQGLITQWDWLPNFLSILARNDSPVLSLHGYHGHPNGFTSKGSSVNQSSSIETAANYWAALALNRMADRPFFIPEYGQVFWNKYRYEEGLLFGSYSSLQGMDSLTAHAASVVPVSMMNKTIKPFTVGKDPIAMASQTVTAFAFLRGDVKTTKNTIETTISKSFVLDKGNYSSAIHSDQLKLALLTGTTVGFRSLKAPRALKDVKEKEPIFTIPPFGTSEINAQFYFAEIKESANTANDQLKATVNKMRSLGILSEKNRTDINRNIYESDTNEILMEQDKKMLKVVTPFLEGICTTARSKPEKIGSMNLVSSSVGASISLISLDKKLIKESTRLLLVIATDALNSNMKFKSDERKVLIDIGSEPALMNTITAKINIETEHKNGMKMWALSLSGKRTEELPVKITKGRLVLDIDTSELTSGPTPYFEISLK